MNHLLGISLRKDMENKMIKDEIILATLLNLKRKERVYVEEMLNDLSLTKKQIEDKLIILEKNKYIQQNPIKNSETPFLKRKYVLALKGIFFVNKLEQMFPQHFN